MAGLVYVRGAAAAVAIPDLGITVAQGPSWTLLSQTSPGDADGQTGQFTARELRDSHDLGNLIAAGTLEWSQDGVAVESAASYIADYPLFQDFTDDFFDARLGRFAFPSGLSTPASGVEGEAFWETDDDILWVWDGTQWVDLVSLASGVDDHGSLTGLADDDHTQYVLIDGSLTRNTFSDGGVDLGAASGLILPQGTDRTGLATEEGNIMWDTDDDIPWFYDGTQWISLDLVLSGVLDHGTLLGLEDDDHPQYTAWEQDETISGVWTFDPADDEPNFILDPRPGAPTQNLVDGAFAVVSGLAYMYDGTRSKWLSVDRTTFTGGRNGNAKNIYLRLADNLASSATGVRMLRDGTITGLFAQTEGAESWTFEVHDSAGGTLASLVISAADGGEDATVDVDVSAGDELRLYVNGSNIMRPWAGFEVAWRI